MVTGPWSSAPTFRAARRAATSGNLYVKGKERSMRSPASCITTKIGTSTESSHFFPRMWDGNNDRGQIDCYRQFGRLAEGDINPTMADNIRYFISYQNATGCSYTISCGAMRANRTTCGDSGTCGTATGPAESPLIDNAMLGDQSKLPNTIHNGSKSYNKLFMLPLILGMIGLFYHLSHRRKDFLVTGLLFFFTGFAIVCLPEPGRLPAARAGLCVCGSLLCLCDLDRAGLYLGPGSLPGSVQGRVLERLCRCGPLPAGRSAQYGRAGMG